MKDGFKQSLQRRARHSGPEAAESGGPLAIRTLWPTLKGLLRSLHGRTPGETSTPSPRVDFPENEAEKLLKIKDNARKNEPKRA